MMQAKTMYPGIVYPATVSAPHNPKNADERDRSKQRVQDPQREIDQKIDGEPRVLGDARFGVVRLCLHNRQLVEMTIGHPAADQRSHQPSPPSQLQTHPGVQQAHRRAGGEQGQASDNHDSKKDVARVLLLESVEKELVPAVYRQGRAKVEKQKSQYRDGQECGFPARGPAPESDRQPHEPFRLIPNLT
jgi:hypothetical protein